MSDGVTIARVVRSEASVQWFEAVALVREVADRLLSMSNDHAIPELQQIQLSSEGHVDLLGVTPTDEPVRRMGQLLQVLVAHSESPVQLRLVITQATAPAPLYKSIREYSDALAFFERPERSTVLQSLASRVTAAAAQDAADRPLTLDSVAPLPSAARADEERKPAPQVQKRQRSSRRALGSAFVALVVLLAAGGGVWYAHSRGLGPQNRAEASDLVNRASDAMGVAIVKGASAVTETIGLGRIVPTKEAEPPFVGPLQTPAPAPPPAKPQSKRQDATPPPGNQPPQVIAFDLDPRVVVEAGDPSAVVETSAPSEPVRSPTSAAVDNQTIYSVETPSVVPPVGVRPKLARQLPPDFDPQRLGRVELIIGANGLVESAKLLGPPRTVNDGLFLSVAKAWAFQPALKDGQPVRYRKTIWVARP